MTKRKDKTVVSGRTKLVRDVKDRLTESLSAVVDVCQRRLTEARMVHLVGGTRPFIPVTCDECSKLAADEAAYLEARRLLYEIRQSATGEGSKDEAKDAARDRGEEKGEAGADAKAEDQATGVPQGEGAGAAEVE